MKSSRMIGTLVAFLAVVWAQDHAHGQDMHYTDPPTKESSSFVPDPDPLDPLPANAENIKEGDEIILDDIKEVLDKKMPEPEVTTTPASGSDEVTSSETNSNSESVTTPAPAPKKSASKPKRSAKKKNLVSDDPDYNLESQFHSNYMKFKLSPTSETEWAKVTGGQSANEYVVQSGDTLYDISRVLFGDSQFWPKLWAVNRDNIFNPHIIKPGLVLYFYAGSATQVPTLSLDKPQESPRNGDIQSDSDEEVVYSTDEDGDEVSKGTNPNNKLTVFRKSKGLGKNSENPTPIPGSLPAYRDFPSSGQQEQAQFQLRDIQYNDTYKPKNPYVLSSVDLKSDFVIKESQNDRVVCREKQFFPSIFKQNLQAGAGRYLIVEKTVPNSSYLKQTYKYKKIGTVDINDQNEMRVSSCDELYSADSLIVSNSQLETLPEPVETFKKSAFIVDSLGDQKRDFYAPRDMVILSGDGVSLVDGAEFSIYSDEVGASVGKVKVLKKAGTLAIGVITDSSNLIQTGDHLVQ